MVSWFIPVCTYPEAKGLLFSNWFGEKGSIATCMPKLLEIRIVIC